MFVMEGKLREQEGVALAKARALEAEKNSAANFLANQKDQRIEHLHARAVKRFGNQGVIRGWTAWQDQWLAKCRRKRMLKAAAARLTKPKLTASLAHWRNDWEYELLKAKVTLTLTLTLALTLTLGSTSCSTPRRAHPHPHPKPSHPIPNRTLTRGRRCAPARASRARRAGGASRRSAARWAAAWRR